MVVATMLSNDLKHRVIIKALTSAGTLVTLAAVVGANRKWG